jgi:PEP-CTERM motif
MQLTTRSSAASRASFATVCLLAATAASPARAAFVATSAESFIQVANASIQYGYNIDSLGHPNSSGFQTFGGCAASCTASGTGPTDTTGTLTSSIVTSQMSYNDGKASASASASANANLATGTVGVSGTGSHLDVSGNGGQDGGTGIAQAIANDMLHFSVAGAAPGAVTDIGVTFTIDGNVGYAGPGVEAAADVEAHLYMGSANFNTIITANGNLVPTVGATTANNWVSFVVSPETPGLITFKGMYAITGSTTDVGIQENLFAQCGGGDSCDYAHTARVSFDLPSNVSFTSDSGIFLTPSAVPEPGTWALTLAGLALGACLGRRRRGMPARA